MRRGGGGGQGGKGGDTRGSVSKAPERSKRAGASLMKGERAADPATPPTHLECGQALCVLGGISGVRLAVHAHKLDKRRRRVGLRP